MSITLEQLRENRLDLIEAHRKNHFTDGIHALLTDLYPDTAHFIYELLQNAEDMKATVVRFTLDTNHIDFEHNGTKRAFNIADIDAITSIGHNGQKKDDLTSIGKFGVGFKAVFAYTSTPIIHSGDYHFKIEQYFVPEFHGVEKVSTVDSDGVAWTKFSFPFNNPNKPDAVAFAECSAGLNALDSSAVLFLRNIKKIEYTLPGGLGHVELVENGNHHATVTCKKPNDSETYTSRWLRFDRMVHLIDDQGNPKTLPTAIAFSLKYDAKSQKDSIVPVEGGGRTFIYFPAEKEYSGLRFHINAPFASTVARDSVRNCEDNKKLLQAISKLICDSLPEIKAQGLMNHSFFEVLPHSKDNLSAFYQPVWNDICSAFQTNDYLPTKSGGYTSAQNALVGPPSISNVLQEAALQTLFDLRKTWIINAPQRNSHADHFIQSLNIQSFTFKDFAQMFEPSVRAKTEQLLKPRPSDWLKRFYALCVDAHENLGFPSYYAFAQNMKQTKMVRSTRGEMYRSAEIYILPVNVELITKTTPIVEQAFVLPSPKPDKTQEKVHACLRKILGIQEYGPKVEIEKLLRAYENGIEPNDRYFKDLIVFAKYQAEHNDIDFSAQKILLYCDTKTATLQPAKAPDLFLGKAYGNDYGEILAPVYEKACLWDGYSEYYTETELSQFLALIRACGIAKGLKIVDQSARLNPLYPKRLSSGRPYNGRGVNLDYTIPNLEKLLKLRSPMISKLLWKTLEADWRRNGSRHTTARYAPNGSATPKTCDSSLIYYLKTYPWLPNKQGILFQPKHISPSDLQDGFTYNSENALLAALEIGSAIETKSQEWRNLEQTVTKAGMRLIPEADFEEYQQWKEQKQATKNIAPLSAQELFEKQRKASVASINGGDDFSTDGAVNNVSRRETNIESTFRNARQMNPAQRQLFARVVESTEEERNQLRYWYQGACQMCGTAIIKYNQTPHFIAKNVINTQHLSASIRQTTSLAWNSLCLCPNCAAKYEVCSRDLNGLFEQIMQAEIIEGDSERIVLFIELDGKRQEIRYIPKHFLALKKVIQLIDDESKE